MLRETLGNQFMLGKSCMKKDEHTLNPTIDTILINSAALLKFRLFYLCFSDRTGTESVGRSFYCFHVRLSEHFGRKSKLDGLSVYHVYHQFPKKLHQIYPVYHGILHVSTPFSSQEPVEKVLDDLRQTWELPAASRSPTLEDLLRI